MATSQIANNFQFNWGETVIVIPSAPPEYRPKELGSICGMRTTNIQPSEVLYLVEFGDGFTMEIPGKFLEKFLEEPDMG